MNTVAQLIVDLSWGLTWGALLAAGTLAAQFAAGVLGPLAALGLVWVLWRRFRRRGG